LADNRDRQPPSAQGPQQALKDIEFIKELISRNKRKVDESPPYLLIWGTYVMIGFVGMHFDMSVWPNWYWAIGAIAASALTAVAGIRQARRSPSPASEVGAFGWMFWLPFLAVFLTGSFLLFSGIVRAEHASFLWMSLVGVAYVSLGPLTGRGTVVLGLWFIVLAIATRAFLLDYQFLVLGLLGGGSLVATGFVLLLRGKAR